MDEMVNFTTEDVYEPPVLAEAGDYAEVTQGMGTAIVPEGTDTYYF